MSKMTDKEMLFLVYGYVRATDHGECPSEIVKLLEEHLFPDLLLTPKVIAEEAMKELERAELTMYGAIPRTPS